MDEARFGLRVWHRRRWCPRGVRPPWIYEDRYEWLWLYAAVEPQGGESCFLLMSKLDGECFQDFLLELRRRFPEGEIVLVLDNTGSHRSGEVDWPEGLSPLHLPPYSPELNPVEGIFKDLRGRLANRVFESLAELEEALCEALRIYWEDRVRLQSLTAYPWWTGEEENIKTLS